MLKSKNSLVLRLRPCYRDDHTLTHTCQCGRAHMQCVMACVCRSLRGKFDSRWWMGSMCVTPGALHEISWSGTILYPTHPVDKAFASMCARMDGQWPCVCECVRALQSRYNIEHIINEKFNKNKMNDFDRHADWFIYILNFIRIARIALKTNGKLYLNLFDERAKMRDLADFEWWDGENPNEITNKIISQSKNRAERISKFSLTKNLCDVYLITAKRVLSSLMCHHQIQHRAHHVMNYYEWHYVNTATNLQ